MITVPNSLWRRLPALGAGLLLAAVPAPLRAQLSQITSCVEVAPGGSSTRTGTGVDCNPLAARGKAISDAHRDARDARGSVCIDDVSAEEAAAICAAASGSVPTTTTTSLAGEPFPASGRSSINSSLPISGSSPKLCTVLRDQPENAVTTTRPSLFCPFDGFVETAVSFPSNARCGVQCFDVHQHSLQVRRFETVSLGAGEADGILAEATEVLKTDDGAADVACSVTLSRLISVSTFATGDGSIDTAAELNAVFSLAGNIKVVEDINFCGGIGTNIIGCGQVPGDSLIVVRFTPSLEGILWAHEFGHNQGLPHRNSATAVMNPIIGADRRRVTSSECSAYRDVVSAAFAEAQGASESDGEGPLPIEAFVRQLFIEGVPYAQGSHYDPAAALGLLKMLGDVAEQQHWSNVVTVLGMSGDERAVAPLIKFIESGRGTLTREHYRAKTDAVMALGYVVNRTGSTVALKYLEEGLQPESWTRRLVGGAALSGKGPVERDRDLAKHAVLGLALSGHPDAGRVLEALEGEAAFQAPTEFLGLISDVVAQARIEHGKVAEKGLTEYYRSGK